MKFRNLKAEEVECRIATVTEKGISLLLYKDARVDMNILDETVGPMNWMRTHTRDNANCIISIWDTEKGQWVSKEDTGTESYTEAEKGLASDSFKRAGTNWGIGRELYTAPFIWVPAVGKDGAENYKLNSKGKPEGNFKVQYMAVEYGRITALAIDNLRLRRSVFTFGNCFPAEEEPSKVKLQPIPHYINAEGQEKILAELHRTGWNVKGMMEYLGEKFPNMPPADLSTITDTQYAFIMTALSKKPTKG